MYQCYLLYTWMSRILDYYNQKTCIDFLYVSEFIFASFFFWNVKTSLFFLQSPIGVQKVPMSSVLKGYWMSDRYTNNCMRSRVQWIESGEYSLFPHHRYPLSWRTWLKKSMAKRRGCVGKRGVEHAFLEGAGRKGEAQR